MRWKSAYETSDRRIEICTEGKDMNSERASDAGISKIMIFTVANADF